jgi:hypothetical protein
MKHLLYPRRKIDSKGERKFLSASSIKKLEEFFP